MPEKVLQGNLKGREILEAGFSVQPIVPKESAFCLDGSSAARSTPERTFLVTDSYRGQGRWGGCQKPQSV